MTTRTSKALLLTKEQIQKLTPEQQEGVASLALDAAKRRALLSDKARSYRGETWIPALMPALLALLFLFGRPKTVPWVDGLIPFVIIMIVFGITQFQMSGIKRRLDALIELSEPEARVSYEEAELTLPVPSSSASG